MKNEVMEIFFVTCNAGKFNEVLIKFNKTKLNYVLKQSNIETQEIQAGSVKDVSLFKQQSVRNQINGSYFVEDAGFFIDFPLKGFPGVYSSYVMKTLGNEGILKLIEEFQQTKANFKAAIALYFKPLDKVFIFEGIVKGKVSSKIRGTGGFGFDSIFIPDGIPDKTFAELSTEEKNEISHRGQALKQLMAFLKTH